MNVEDYVTSTFSAWNEAKIVERNLLAIHSPQSNNIDFLHVPSATCRKPIERWSIPKFPFEVSRYATYQPKNTLFVAEEREG